MKTKRGIETYSLLCFTYKDADAIVRTCIGDEVGDQSVLFR